MLSRRTLIVSGLSATAAGAVGYGLWPRLGGYEEEAARERRLLASDPALTGFVRMATLAANGHNTQPWKFRLDEDRVRILPDFARRTKVVDPDDHHLFVSLGCAAENLAIAAAAHGRPGDVLISGGPEPHVEIALGQGSATNEALYAAIPLRQSTRSVYDSRPVSAEDLALLKAAAEEDGVSVLIFTDPPDMDAILEFVVAGNSAQMDDPAFVAELLEWIRFSPAQALASKDGLFAACSGNPALPAWAGDLVFNAVFTKQAENDKYRDHIRSSSGVAVFIGNKADPDHWMRVGRSFQRFALQATALGIRNAHINQPVEVPAVRTDFARWLGLPNTRPDLVVRFGRAPALPMSLRRPVADVVL
jgi:hypothetical protein